MVSVEVSTPTRVFRQTPRWKLTAGLKGCADSRGQNLEVTEGKVKSLPDHDRGTRRYTKGVPASQQIHAGWSEVRF